MKPSGLAHAAGKRGNFCKISLDSLREMGCIQGAMNAITQLLATLPRATVETFAHGACLEHTPVSSDGCQDGCYAAEEIRSGITEEISAAVLAGECSGAFGEIRWRICLG